MVGETWNQETMETPGFMSDKLRMPVSSSIGSHRANRLEKLEPEKLQDVQMR